MGNDLGPLFVFSESAEGVVHPMVSVLDEVLCCASVLGRENDVSTA